MRGLARWVRDERQVRDSLWAVPVVFCAVGAALGVVIPYVDHALGAEEIPLPYRVSSAAAANLVRVSAGALASLSAISFSMGMVTIQLAATQYTPRLLRNFMADRTTQVLVGFVIGTVVFLVVLIPSTGGAVVPRLSLVVALLLTVASIVAVPVFFHHVANSVQAASVVMTASRRTVESVHRLPVTATSGASVPGRRPDEVVTSQSPGYLQVLREKELLSALPPGAVARVDLAVGAFAMAGTPLVSVWEVPGLDRDLVNRIREALALSRERNHPQDLLFGVRQLVDVAVRALSPGINDPSTAVMSVNQLATVALELARAGAPARPAMRCRTDRGRTLWLPLLDCDRLLHEAFDEVTVAAREHGRIPVRILESLFHLRAVAARGDLDPVVLEAGRRVVELATRDGPLPQPWHELLEHRWQDLAERGADSEDRPVPNPTLQ